MISARFLGTGSLGSFRCKNKLSKDYRRFPSLLIDEKIIIDPGEDIFEFAESFMLDGLYDKVTDVLITHSHVGHFSISAIERLSRGKNIRVYASETLEGELADIPTVTFFPIYKFTPVNILGYDVVPCPSNHKTDNPCEVAFNFYIGGDKALFYGLDGGWMLSETFNFLKHARPDAFVLDVGGGSSDFCECCFYHNNLHMARNLREALMSSGAAAQSAKFVLSHIPSHKSLSVHEELSAGVEDLPDVKIAYDGYCLFL